MVDYSLDCLKAIYQKKWIIIGVTCLAFALSVIKVIVVPPHYFEAEAILIVASPNVTGDFGDHLSTELEPKVYEELLTSSTVLQNVLEKLTSEGTFGDDEAPKLEVFASMVSAKLKIVDQTTRPVNYSPLIKLVAQADDAELAGKIADAWADVSVETAKDANYLRIGVLAKMLDTQEQEYRNTLDGLWVKEEEEKAEFDIVAMSEELNVRLSIINGLISEQASLERSEAEAEARLASIRENLEGEQEFVELLRAPDEAAVWLLEAEADRKSALENIRKKGMVTQELNKVYWDLRSQEQLILSTIAANTAKMKENEVQIGRFREEAKQMRQESAEHVLIQQRLGMEVGIASKIYGHIASAESMTTAVAAFLGGDDEDKDFVVGLNRLSQTTPVKKAGTGRKAIVILFTMTTFFLSIVFVVCHTLAKPVLDSLQK